MVLLLGFCELFEFMQNVDKLIVYLRGFLRHFNFVRRINFEKIFSLVEQDKKLDKRPILLQPINRFLNFWIFRCDC